MTVVVVIVVLVPATPDVVLLLSVLVLGMPVRAPPLPSPLVTAFGTASSRPEMPAPRPSSWPSPDWWTTARPCSCSRRPAPASPFMVGTLVRADPPGGVPVPALGGGVPCDDPPLGGAEPFDDLGPGAVPVPGRRVPVGGGAVPFDAVGAPPGPPPGGRGCVVGWC